MTIELVTYAQLKALLKLEKAAITDYPALDELRDSVTFAIEEFIGRLLEPIARVDTKFIGATPSQMIYLPGVPVVSVASVIVTRSGVDTTITAYDITDYGIRLSGKILHSKIIVTYTGGISVVSGDLNRAALMQTAYEFQSKEQIGAESVSTDGGFVSRPALQLLPEVKRMLGSAMHPLKY